MNYIKYYLGIIVFFLLLLSDVIFLPAAHDKSVLSNSKKRKISNNLSELNETKKADRIFDKFFKKWEITGAAVAIIKDENLIYAKGFGYIDKEQTTATEPYHLFRIASVSKLITAVAIMKLVEDNRIKLSDKVFGVQGILNDPQFLNYKDKRYEKITVEHLLRHEGGWLRKYGDPILMTLDIAKELKIKPPVDADAMIQFMHKKKIHFDPGSRSAYSNFGYVILGKIIEKKSGVSYENFVKNNILAPVGITDMHVANILPSQKYKNEVNYYDHGDSQPVPSCLGTGELAPRCYGGIDSQTSAAAGGWTCSVVALAKFLVSIDGFPAHKDILTKKSIQQMTDYNAKSQPMGWRKTNIFGDWTRTGSFAGTVALVKRCMNGISYIVVTNTGTWRGPRFYHEIEGEMQKVLGSIKTWPNQNLFEIEPIKIISKQS